MSFSLDTTPVEVKYTDRIDRRELKGTYLYMEKYGINKGIVLTKDTLDTWVDGGKQLMLIPVWLFLIMLS